MEIIDQTGRKLSIAHHPKKIVSLVPSITELLFGLGLGNKIAGITDYCIHPADGVVTKRKIGGPKNIEIAEILSLNPDLVIASKEENEKEPVERLKEKCNVYVSDVKSINHALSLIADIGSLTGREHKSEIMIRQIETGLKNLSNSIKTKKRAVYLIWNNPLMTINSDTFINDMLRLAGFENVFSQKSKRYPQISRQEIKTQNPDYILLSTEPYPFFNEHVTQFSNEFPKSKILLVDGEMFSWYGSHLLKVPEYFKHLL